MMKPTSHVLGQTAESLASLYLRKKGYRILGQNVRLPGGELDLIAQYEHTIIFVEVKARRSESHGGTHYAITTSKKQRIIKLAALYLAQKKLSQQLSRFDVILCQGDDHDTLEVTHIENAFEIPGEDIRW